MNFSMKCSKDPLTLGKCKVQAFREKQLYKSTNCIIVYNVVAKSRLSQFTVLDKFL